jgi:hypothetical protein
VEEMMSMEQGETLTAIATFKGVLILATASAIDVTLPGIPLW